MGGKEWGGTGTKKKEAKVVRQIYDDRFVDKDPTVLRARGGGGGARPQTRKRIKRRKERLQKMCQGWGRKSGLRFKPPNADIECVGHTQERTSKKRKLDGIEGYKACGVGKKKRL